MARTRDGRGVHGIHRSGRVAARDRVRHWITQNEPWVASWLGYGLGVHAPGRKSDSDALAAGHHILVAHGRAAEVLRREAPASEVGIAIDLVPMYPFSDNEADVEAAHREDGFRNRWFLEPVLGRGYPEDMLERYAEILPTIEDGDMDTIAAPLDFLGINYYTRSVVRASVGEVPAEGAEHTEMGWEVYPDGLYRLLVHLQTVYEPPSSTSPRMAPRSRMRARTGVSPIPGGSPISRGISTRS